MKKSAVFLLVLFSICLSICNAQMGASLTDTSRYFPAEMNFPQPSGWQITSSKANLQSRDFESQSVLGYRYILDSHSSPQTGLSFFVVVTKVRSGEVSDPKTGMSMSRAAYAYRRMFENSQSGHMIGAKSSVYGDQSFVAEKDMNNYKIFIQRGSFLIDITGTDVLPSRTDKPAMKDICHFFADFIDSRIFGVRIGNFTPIQILNDSEVPLVAGKKMAVYTAIELEKGSKLPENYIMDINMGERGFSRTSYQFPLNLTMPLEFDPICDDSDGCIWKNEYAEMVEIDNQTASFLRITDNPNYDLYLYRIFLDPSKPDFYGDYVFRVTVEDTATGSKLREHTYKIPTRQSKKLRLAVMPIPIGYWSPPENWKVDDWSWISGMGDQAWERKSFVRFAAPLSEEVQRKFTMYPRIKEYLKKHLITSEGQLKYQAQAREGRDYLKAVFPLAEEWFEIYVYDAFPGDLEIEPHPESVDAVTVSLKKWQEKHPRFDRVIGIIPGANPGRGGVSFYLSEPDGQNLWMNKNFIVIPVDGDPFQYAHELAHSFGAVDEWIEPAEEYSRGVMGGRYLNTPVGTAGGQLVNMGFWPAKKSFMGTPSKPVNSIMGKKSPAWIPANIFKSILKKLER